jgi:hypothetical protein
MVLSIKWERIDWQCSTWNILVVVNIVPLDCSTWNIGVGRAIRSSIDLPNSLSH